MTSCWLPWRQTALRWVLAAGLSVAGLEGIAETISYQGRLVDGGQAATGSYDFQFLLMDAATGGQSLGPAVSSTLTVRQGVFTAPLSFAPEHFTGASRWIEVRVRPTPATGTEGGAYAVLERQPVQFAPYAYRALAASTVTSVPVQSLPASVPLKNAEGKLDSGLMGADIARTSDVTTLAQSLQQALSQLAELQTQVAALTQSNAVLRQSVEAAGAPSRTGWMTASADGADAALIAAGFSKAFSTPGGGWTNASAVGAPSSRVDAAGAWTGQEWLVWGGRSGSTALGSGAGYRPSTDTWVEMAASDAPEARSGHTAVWTGSELIVWGGFGRTSLNTGGRFARGKVSWEPVTTLNAPLARQGHGAAWTGRHMVVFGGRNASGLIQDGGMYDPSTDQWTALPTLQAPSARSGATVVWTGAGVLVWGGETVSGGDATGAYLRCDAGGNPLAWEALPMLSGFAGRSGHVSAWDGQRLMVWGGRSMGRELLSDGAVLVLATGTWTRMSGVGAPTARHGASGVWTGEELLVLGGQDAGGVVGGGHAWRMASGTWRSLPASTARSGALAAWNGSEAMVFGGLGAGGVAAVAQPQRLAGVPPWHFYRRDAP